MSYFEIQETIAAIREKTEARPRVGIVLGTGLSRVLSSLTTEQQFAYRDLPHFPISTVESHLGNLILGKLAGVPVAVLQGRFHAYEGYTPAQVAYPIQTLKFLGVEKLIVTNAAGGLNPRFHSGEIMAITDHINLTGRNPLAGPNDERLGPRFPDMTEPYCRKLLALAETTALRLGLKLQQGVYVGILGPSMETAAETRYLRQSGADAVGMSTIFEVIAAVHLGLKVLGLSVISNVNLPDAYRPAPLEDIIANVKKAEEELKLLIEGLLSGIDNSK